MYEKRNDLLDITNGAYDRAEVYELVGDFLLCQHSQKIDKKNISLNGDRGLVVHKKNQHTQISKTHKNASSFISSK